MNFIKFYNLKENIFDYIIYIYFKVFFLYELFNLRMSYICVYYFVKGIFLVLFELCEKVGSNFKMVKIIFVCFFVFILLY